MERIGITTTVPQEIIWAAGLVPVDLNNVFVGSERREGFLARARRDGYPRTVCPWISGIYGAMREQDEIRRLVIVTQGDCSNTHALAETLEDAGVEIIPFAYPYDGDPKLLRGEMEHLAFKLGADWSDISRVYDELAPVREKLRRLDELTWGENKVSGLENHIWLVESSDFRGDIDNFTGELDEKISEIESRKPLENTVRLGYIGVPPIFPGIYDRLEEMGARVVFNEVQRQFSLPTASGFLADYADYTYPASVFRRIEDIRAEIERRDIDGILHYTQSFCFRQIEDLLFRRHLPVPILTVEGENSFELDERIVVRMEAFVRMLEGNVDAR